MFEHMFKYKLNSAIVNTFPEPEPLYVNILTEGIHPQVIDALKCELGKKHTDPHCLSAFPSGTIPVVIITGQGDEIASAKMVQNGAYGLMSKTRISVKSLTRVINQTIEKSRLKRDLKRLIEF